MDIPIAERQAMLRAFSSWKALGRISVSSTTQAISGGIDWEQRDNRYRVALSSPLGQALFIEQGDDQATLQRQGKQPVLGRSAEALVYEQLNVRVPLDQLTQWLRGLPGDQGKPAYDPYGRLRKLSYTDPDNINWRADIRRYQAVDGMDLPALVVVQGGGYDIRLTVREWQSLAEEHPTPEPAAPAQEPGKRLSIPGLDS